MHSFLKTIGRGPTLSRSLSRSEAREAMSLMLTGKALPEQIGALLLVLRYRGETAEELVGFVEAARALLPAELGALEVDLDWPSYADRHRQPPFFVLSARLLAERGVKILMHGTAGRKEGCAPTRPAVEALGLPMASSSQEAAQALECRNFAYLGLEDFAPGVAEVLSMRDRLGVRTVANSFARILNPAAAPFQLQPIVHPAFRGLLQEAAAMLHQHRSLVFKGIGGEAQRNPYKALRMAKAYEGQKEEVIWPAQIDDAGYPWRQDPLDPSYLAQIWSGEAENEAAAAAVQATAALGLWCCERAETFAEADVMAKEAWQVRDRSLS